MCEVRSVHAAALCVIAEKFSAAGFEAVMMDLFWVYLVFALAAALVVAYQYLTHLQRARHRANLHAQLLDVSNRITALEAKRDRQLVHLDGVVARRAAAEDELDRRIEEGASTERVAQAEIRLAELDCDERYWANKVRETVVGLAGLYTRESELAHLLR